MNDREIREEMLRLNAPGARREYRKWIAEAPPCIQRLAAKHPHNVPYIVMSSCCLRLAVGAVVGIRAFYEGGQASVIVLRSDDSECDEGDEHMLDPETLRPYTLVLDS